MIPRRLCFLLFSVSLAGSACESDKATDTGGSGGVSAGGSDGGSTGGTGGGATGGTGGGATGGVAGSSTTGGTGGGATGGMGGSSTPGAVGGTGGPGGTGTGGATGGAGGIRDGGATGGAGGAGTGGARDGAAAGGGGGSSGSSALTGMYGTMPIRPIVNGLWIGRPNNPAELGGGPMIYLFSENTTCATLSMKARWRPLVPASTQITEMIIGTNMVGKPIPATDTAAPGAGEFNFTYGMSSTETRASSGTMTLTKYTPGVAVEGTVNVMYPGGAVTGTFHADWCAGGREM